MGSKKGYYELLSSGHRNNLPALGTYEISRSLQDTNPNHKGFIMALAKRKRPLQSTLTQATSALQDIVLQSSKPVGTIAGPGSFESHLHNSIGYEYTVQSVKGSASFQAPSRDKSSVGLTVPGPGYYDSKDDSLKKSHNYTYKSVFGSETGRTDIGKRPKEVYYDRMQSYSPEFKSNMKSFHKAKGKQWAM